MLTVRPKLHYCIDNMESAVVRVRLHWLEDGGVRVVDVDGYRCTVCKEEFIFRDTAIEIEELRERLLEDEK